MQVARAVGHQGCAPWSASGLCGRLVGGADWDEVCRPLDLDPFVVGGAAPAVGVMELEENRVFPEKRTGGRWTLQGLVSSFGCAILGSRD